MSISSQFDPINPRIHECMRLKNCGTWFMVLGIALMALGAMAIGATFITALTTVVVFGILLVSSGIVQIVNAFLGRGWRGFFAHLLAGLLHLILGILMIEHPIRAAADLTLVIALAFLVGGVIRIISALTEHFTDWGWVLVHGIVASLLGLAIWRQWPESSFWVIGTFVGIDLIFNGWSWVTLGMIVKAPTPVAQLPAPGLSH